MRSSLSFSAGLLAGLVLMGGMQIASASHEERSLSLHHQNPQNLVARSTTAGLTSLYVTPNGPIEYGVPAQVVVVDRDLEGGTPNWQEIVATIGEGEFLYAAQGVGTEYGNLTKPMRFRYDSEQPFLTVARGQRRWDGGLDINKSENPYANALTITNRHENATGVGIVVGVGTGLDYRLMDVQRSGTNTTVTLSALRNGGEYPTLRLDGTAGEAYLRGMWRMQALPELPPCVGKMGTLAVWNTKLWYCDGGTWLMVGG